MHQIIESIRISTEKLGQQTHAGFAMVVAAALDRLLEEGLTAKMVKLNREMRDQLFGDYGTLRDFSAKINVAFAVGLVDRQTYQRLTAVRKVRKLFAHTKGLIHFESQGVRDLLAAQLTDPKAAFSINDFVLMAESIETNLIQAAGLPHQKVIGTLNADR